MAQDIQSGDVMAVRTGSLFGWLIRFGSFLRGKPDLQNHVVVAHHVDKHGTMWGIEGRPGGVGWVDCAVYDKATTVTNAAQPKTLAQRAAVCDTMLHLIGTAYDWQAIESDAATDLGITLPGWNPTWAGTVPGHVVCSSVAQYAYLKAGLPAPSGDRGCQPSDWAAFIDAQAWNSPRP